VEQGYAAIAKNEPGRVKVIDATQPIEAVAGAIWQIIARLPGIAKSARCD
jgi:thymidylate kinase